jgi:lipoyl-dependent peroxiredoxin
MPQLSAPPVSLLDPYQGKEILPLYTTSVIVTGGEARHGRASGIARSNDGALDLHLRLPRELGGPGGGTNPEQLLAAGYAACFHGALNLIAAKQEIAVKDAEVIGSVTFGRDPDDGLFLLTIKLSVKLPSVEKAAAEKLIRETEEICPYAKMARKGIRSTVEMA